LERFASRSQPIEIAGFAGFAGSGECRVWGFLAKCATAFVAEAIAGLIESFHCQFPFCFTLLWIDRCIFEWPVAY
jgi:hypothetical protein